MQGTDRGVFSGGTKIKFGLEDGLSQQEQVRSASASGQPGSTVSAAAAPIAVAPPSQPEPSARSAWRRLALPIFAVLAAFGFVALATLRWDAWVGAAAIQMLFGGIFMTIAGTVMGEWSHLAFSTRTTIAFIYLTFAGSVVAFAAYSYALRHLDVAIVSLYTYVNPIIAVALGAWLLGEPVGWRMFVADPQTGNREESAQLVVHINFAGKTQDIPMRYRATAAQPERQFWVAKWIVPTDAPIDGTLVVNVNGTDTNLAPTA